MEDPIYKIITLKNFSLNFIKFALQTRTIDLITKDLELRKSSGNKIFIKQEGSVYTWIDYDDKTPGESKGDFILVFSPDDFGELVGLFRYK